MGQLHEEGIVTKQHLIEIDQNYPNVFFHIWSRISFVLVCLLSYHQTYTDVWHNHCSTHSFHILALFLVVLRPPGNCERGDWKKSSCFFWRRFFLVQYNGSHSINRTRRRWITFTETPWLSFTRYSCFFVHDVLGTLIVFITICGIYLQGLNFKIITSQLFLWLKLILVWNKMLNREI